MKPSISTWASSDGIDEREVADRRSGLHERMQLRATFPHMNDAPKNAIVQLDARLPSEMEAGAFADFAGVWHTPASFVIDFLAATQPPKQDVGGDGTPTGIAVLPARVVSRVRIPPEQVVPLINALQEQLTQWLSSTGRSEPPEAWMPRPLADG